MALPGFTAEAVVQFSRNQYWAAMSGPGDTGVVPALPSCKTCDWACDKCFMIC